MVSADRVAALCSPVELGALMMVASTKVPGVIMTPASASQRLMALNNWRGQLMLLQQVAVRDGGAVRQGAIQG